MRLVSLAVLHGDPTQVIVADDLDVYESCELYEPGDVEMGPAELQFKPLFRGSPPA